jgi:hypothetical protein
MCCAADILLWLLLPLLSANQPPFCQAPSSSEYAADAHSVHIAQQQTQQLLLLGLCISLWPAATVAAAHVVTAPAVVAGWLSQLEVLEW